MAVLLLLTVRWIRRIPERSEGWYANRYDSSGGSRAICLRRFLPLWKREAKIVAVLSVTPKALPKIQRLTPNALIHNTSPIPPILSRPPGEGIRGSRRCCESKSIFERGSSTEIFKWLITMPFLPQLMSPEAANGSMRRDLSQGMPARSRSW